MVGGMGVRACLQPRIAALSSGTRFKALVCISVSARIKSGASCPLWAAAPKGCSQSSCLARWLERQVVRNGYFTIADLTIHGKEAAASASADQTQA
jgi:hypothetical protein